MMTTEPLPATDRNLYKRLTARLILAVAIVLGLTFLLPPLVRLTAPFLVALFVAILLNPLVRWVNRKLLPSRRATTMIITLIFVLATISLTFILLYRVIREIVSLTYYLQMNWPSLLAQFDESIMSLEWILDLLPEQAIAMLQGVRASIVSFLQDAVMNIVSSTASFLAATVTRVGNIFISVLTFFLAMYSLIADYDSVRLLTQRVIGERGMRGITLIKTSIFKTFGGFLRAQLIFAFFAFVFMFIALSLYGQPYALLIALFLAFIDLLPILGTIAVLGPWGVLAYIGGDPGKGIFLIGLGLGFFLFRRVMEPKIMGSQTGLHPLLTLFSVFVGLKYSGVWGALLGPIVMVLVISIFQSGMLDNTVADIQAASAKLTALLSTAQAKRKQTAPEAPPAPDDEDAPSPPL